MQREACHEFAEKMGWTIGKEFLEKGVSGFKVSASNRDSLTVTYTLDGKKHKLSLPKKWFGS